jgi:uncharacterized membrane protein HdeD (DUF308 family)
VQRAFLASARALSLAQLLIGIALVAATLARGGGPLALGVVLGVLLTALGAARLWLSFRARPREGA